MKRKIIHSVVFFIFYSISLFAQKKESISVHTDPRLAVLIKKSHKETLSGNTNPTAKQTTGKNKQLQEFAKQPSNRGFRVQIYNGPDRNKATLVKADFIKNFPGIKAYISFVTPNYKVKVGNYRFRAEAEGMYREAKGMYSPCMIVPDKISAK